MKEEDSSPRSPFIKKHIQEYVFLPLPPLFYHLISLLKSERILSAIVMSSRFPLEVLHLIVGYVEWDIITKFLRENWKELDKYHLCYNSHIPFTFFESILDTETDLTLDSKEGLDWDGLLRNNGISLSFVTKYIHKLDCISICWRFLCFANLPESFFEENLDKVIWENLSQNWELPLTFFQKHLDKVNWKALCGNIGIPSSFFESLSDESKLYWSTLSGNSSVSVSFFEKHVDEIDWDGISENTGIPLSSQGIAFLEKHVARSLIDPVLQAGLDKINWTKLCENPSVPISFFGKYLDKIEWDEFRKNPNVPVSFFEDILSKKIRCKNGWSLSKKIVWPALCMNLGIPLSFFRKHRQKIHWGMLSLNNNIPVSFLMKNKDKKLDWSDISRWNVSITLDTLNAPGSKIQKSKLSENEHFFSNVAREELFTLLKEIL